MTISSDMANSDRWNTSCSSKFY